MQFRYQVNCEHETRFALKFLSHILASSQDLFVAGSHEDAVDRCCEMFKAKIAEQKTLKQMTTVEPE